MAAAAWGEAEAALGANSQQVEVLPPVKAAAMAEVIEKAVQETLAVEAAAAGVLALFSHSACVQCVALVEEMPFVEEKDRKSDSSTSALA